MATICNQCGNIIGDIYPLGGGHVCWRYNAWTPAYPYPPQPIKPLKGQKCDLCGSTAIDHNEMSCQFNRLTTRLSKHIEGNDLKLKGSKAKTKGNSESPKLTPRERLIHESKQD